MICTPTRGICMTDWAMSLAFMVDKIHAEPPEGLTHMTMVSDQSSLLPAQRHRLAKGALEKGFTHILWLDDDMLFPADTLHCLVKHNLDIVGANYSKKYPPFVHTAQGMDDRTVFTKSDSTGLEPVKHIGMGVCLMSTNVLKQIEAPWFPIGWEPTRKEYFGEDVFFFQRARKAGFQPFVDHDLSKRVSHVGLFPYTHDIGADALT